MCHSVFLSLGVLWIPWVYLEVRGTLEGLPADPTAVDALLPMHLLAVVHEHGS